MTICADDIATNASKWAEFVAFDKAQFDEIQAQYAPDMYWLDAGWVGQGAQYLPLADWAAAHRKINPEQLWCVVLDFNSGHRLVLVVWSWCL